MWTIAAKELRSLFLSPLAWSILGAIQVIFGWAFAILLYWFLKPELQSSLQQDPSALGVTAMVVISLFDWMGVVLLLIVPLLTMRLISEERRNKTLPLLLSAPLSMSSIILGKFLGLMGFLLIMFALLLLMPFSLLLGGQLDLGHLFSGLLGLILLVSTLGAIGLYISTLTDHPVVAAITTFGVVLLLWMLDWSQSVEENPILSYLSLTHHYQPLLQGLFSTEDILYYIFAISLFLILSIQRLDAERIG